MYLHSESIRKCMISPKIRRVGTTGGMEKMQSIREDDAGAST